MTRAISLFKIGDALFLIAFALVLFALGAFPALAQKRLALVIGNDNYENVTRLRKAANDAEGMGRTLTDLGFEVTTATNITRRDMNRKLQAFTNGIGEGDIVLLFFAGHGVEIDGENYLLPIDVPDARGDQLEFIKAETIRLNTVLADLRNKKAQLNLVILDACRNNPFSKKAGRTLGGKKGLARISAPQGTFVMYSADVGETALDRLSDSDANPNSVFTRTLIPLMKTPGVDLVATAREARRRVRKLALSVSHEQTPAYYDAVLGDFYFTQPDDSVSASDLPKETTAIKPNQEIALAEQPKSGDIAVRPLSPLSQDNRTLPALVVTAGEKDLIRLWDIDKMVLFAELKGEKKLFSTIKLINKGRGLMVAGLDGSVVTYSLPSFKKISAFYPDFEVSVLAQAEDGTLLAGANNGLLAAYDGKTLEEKWRRQAHDGIVSPILVRGSEIISASQDGAIVTTDIKSGRETGRAHTFAGGRITDISLINKRTLVAVHEKGEVAYIAFKENRLLSVYQGHDGWISSVDVTPDGSAIVTAGVNGLLKTWPLGGDKPTKSLAAHSDVATGAKFMNSVDGNNLASVGFDGILRIWRRGSKVQIGEMEHGPAIVHFDFLSSP